MRNWFSNAAKLIVKTTKTDGWVGEFRVVGRTAASTAPYESRGATPAPEY